LRWLAVVGLALGLIGFGAWRLHMASGQGATLSLAGVPASVAAGGPTFNVEIRVAGVTNLGAYEWQLAYDPNVVSFVSATDGGFLGSTVPVRSVACQPAILPPSQGLEPGNVRFGCATAGSTPPGPNGGGLLSTVKFQPVGNGAPNIGFVCAGLADIWGEDIPISNVPPCGASVTPTPGPGETPAPTNTPGGTPEATSTPAGPLPTATPLPPGLEAIALVAGCQFVAWTGADSTTPADLSALVGPVGTLRSLWAQQPAPLWRGYSPQFPQVSDMEPVNMLDVVAICMNDLGDFVRPLI